MRVTITRVTAAATATILCTLLLFAGCDRFRRRGQGDTANEGQGTSSSGKGPDKKVAFRDDVGTVFAVNTTRAVKGEILDYLEVNGEVVTRTSVDIYADVAGKLSKLSVSIGNFVLKDQVIAEVDPSKPGMKYVPSPVKSPISGTIIEIPVQVGATISPSVPIARVSKMTQLEIRTHIAERFISKIRLGLEALVYFQAFPESRFIARITELSPVVDPQSRTMEIRLNLVKPDSRIKSGMFAEIKIITEKKEGIVKIPAECMVKRYGGYYVFMVVDTNTVEKRKVSPGIEIDGKLEIVEGLAPDDEIVIRGQTLLEDRAKVKVIERVQPLTEKDIVE